MTAVALSFCPHTTYPIFLRKNLLLRKLRKIFFSSDSLVYAELLPPKGSIIQAGAGNCNVVRRSDYSKEFRSSHSSRTEVTGLRRWVGKNLWLDRRSPRDPSRKGELDPSQSVFRAVATRDHGRSPARTEISTSDEKSILKEFGTVETRMPGLGRC